MSLWGLIIPSVRAQCSDGGYSVGERVGPRRPQRPSSNLYEWNCPWNLCSYWGWSFLSSGSCLKAVRWSLHGYVHSDRQFDLSRDTDGKNVPFRWNVRDSRTWRWNIIFSCTEISWVNAIWTYTILWMSWKIWRRIGVGNGEVMAGRVRRRENGEWKRRESMPWKYSCIWGYVSHAKLNGAISFNYVADNGS